MSPGVWYAILPSKGRRVTFDSLIAVLGLMLAVYAIVPPSQRLAFRLRFTGIDLTISVVALIVIHALLLFSTHPHVKRIADWTPFDPNELAYLVMVLAVVIIILRRLRSRLPKSKVSRLHEYVTQFLALEDFKTLIPLLDRNLDEIAKIAERERTSDDDTQDTTASNVLQAALTNPGFIRVTARNYPDFGIRAMKLGHHEYNFSDEFLRAMLADKHSLLASEIRRNQNLAPDHGYRLEPNNRLLRALFDDATFAEQMAVYRPIGDAMLDELGSLSHARQDDPYVREADRSFRERGQFDLQLFVGLRFFEIMIWCSLRQGIRWHMWLYYFPHFTEVICRNCDEHPEYSDRSEWPNRYCYLLYEMTHALEAWIVSVNTASIAALIPPLGDTTAEHQNDSIPKSSIIALDSCLNRIVLAQTIPNNFTRNLVRSAISVYFTLRGDETGNEYATVFLNVLMQNRPGNYVDLIGDVIANMDRVHLNDDHVKELRDAVTGIV